MIFEKRPNETLLRICSEASPWARIFDIAEGFSAVSSGAMESTVRNMARKLGKLMKMSRLLNYAPDKGVILPTTGPVP